MMNYFWRDLRFGARMLLKKPGFTLIAVTTLMSATDPPTFIAVTLPGRRATRVDPMTALRFG